MQVRLTDLRELLGDAIAQTVHLEKNPTERESHLLLRLCQKAAAKAQTIHNEVQGVPEPRKGE